jgi:hypothetical protein
MIRSLPITLLLAATMSLGCTKAPATAEEAAPDRPEARIEEDGTITIRYACFPEATIHTSDDEVREQLHDCLSDSFDRRFERIENWKPQHAWDEVQRIRDECIRFVQESSGQGCPRS